MSTYLKEEDINNFLGDMDLFLIDQVLKGTFEPRGRLLDAGCGSGRNMVYFLQKQWQVWGLDQDRSQLALVRLILQGLSGQDSDRLIEASVESIPIDSSFFDVVVCSRVLHLLPDSQAIFRAWQQLYRVLKPGGILYISMNSSINFESHVFQGGDAMSFKDGTKGVFLTPGMLDEMESLGFERLEEHRTLHFGDQHAETTMILRKL